uniref:Uncharacterized protein n=1 Tax=Brassica campestris TaxID=3711 RepID=A0A3P6DHC1_BRACM|nr:unnamed protein product [Brassica rapa]
MSLRSSLVIFQILREIDVEEMLSNGSSSCQDKNAKQEEADRAEPLVQGTGKQLGHLVQSFRKITE